jgi:hypothetical protein
MKKTIIPSLVGVAAFGLGVFLENKFGIASKVTKRVPFLNKNKKSDEATAEPTPEPENPEATQEGTK